MANLYSFLFILVKTTTNEDWVDTLFSRVKLKPVTIKDPIKKHEREQAAIAKAKASLEFGPITSSIVSLEMRLLYRSYGYTNLGVDKETNMDVSREDGLTAKDYKKASEIINLAYDTGEVGIVSGDSRMIPKILAMEAAKAGHPITSKFWFGSHHRYSFEGLLPSGDHTTLADGMEYLGLEYDDEFSPMDKCISIARKSGILI